jgi:hypothetical protein
MGIRTYHYLARQRIPFSHKLMTYATPDVREMETGMTCKVAKFMLEVGGRRIVGRDDVIEQDKEISRAGELASAESLPRLEGEDTGPIVNVGPVNPAVNVFAGRGSEYSF